MFPVTLESTGGLLQTYQTPCYGFLRTGEWEDDDYGFCDGWSQVVGYPWNPASKSEPFGTNCLWNYGPTVHSKESRTELEDLRYIWNSGAVIPAVGLDEKLKVIAKQLYNSGQIYYGEDPPKPVDNVAKWSAASGIPYTREEFLNSLESWIDAGRESAMVWDHRGFMGVRADVPADRALFYLMVDRELWCKEFYDKTKFIMEQIHHKNRSPIIAFFMSRLIATETNAIGEERIYYSGNTGDCCILPDSLFVSGVGGMYKTPIAVNWVQNAYSSGYPHERDEDIDENNGAWYFESEKYCASVSNSMFNPLFMLEQSSTSPVSLLGAGEAATPICRTFASTVIGDDILKKGYYQYWNIGELINDRLEDGKNIIPAEEWEDIIYNLLMGE